MVTIFIVDDDGNVYAIAENKLTAEKHLKLVGGTFHIVDDLQKSLQFLSRAWDVINPVKERSE